MKLETSIPARRDGTVIARTPDKSAYQFTPDGDGVLACNVDDESHVKWLIDTGMFYPASDEDFERASMLMQGKSDESDSLDDALMKMTRADLILMAEEHGIVAKANDNKAEIIAAIIAKRDAA